MNDEQTARLLKINELLLNQCASLRAEISATREGVSELLDRAKFLSDAHQPAAIWLDEMVKTRTKQEESKIFRALNPERATEQQ